MMDSFGGFGDPPPATTVTGPPAAGDPAVVGTGLKYARDDHIHGAPAASTPQPAEPLFPTGLSRWVNSQYNPPAFSAALQTTLGLDALIAIPIYLPTCTVDRFGIWCNAIVANAACRMGLYNSAAGVPTTLVVESGSVAVATVGFKTATVSQAVTEGWYWLAYVSQTAVPNVEYGGNVSRSLWSSTSTQPTGISTTNVGAAAAYKHNGVVSGALPTWSGLVDWGNGNLVPLVYLRIA